MFSPPQDPMNRVTINPDRKTVNVLSNISDYELHTFLKEYWMQNKILMGMGFPLRMEGSCFILSGGWTLESIASYNNISPKIKMKKPIPPIVPSQTRKYKRIYVTGLASVESLLAACPKEIHHKNIHLKTDGDKIFLEILGQWPNPDWEIEQKKFKENYKKWEREHSFYESIMAN